MARKRKPILDNKERYYNVMLEELNKQDNNFDINKISNGEYCFYDFINFLKINNMYEEFEEFTIELEAFDDVCSEEEIVTNDHLPFNEEKLK